MIEIGTSATTSTRWPGQRQRRGRSRSRAPRSRRLTTGALIASSGAFWPNVLADELRRQRHAEPRGLLAGRGQHLAVGIDDRQVAKHQVALDDAAQLALGDVAVEAAVGGEQVAHVGQQQVDADQRAVERRFGAAREALHAQLDLAARLVLAAHDQPGRRRPRSRRPAAVTAPQIASTSRPRVQSRRGLAWLPPPLPSRRRSGQLDAARRADGLLPDLGALRAAALEVGRQDVADQDLAPPAPRRPALARTSVMRPLACRRRRWRRRRCRRCRCWSRFRLRSRSPAPASATRAAAAPAGPSASAAHAAPLATNAATPQLTGMV